VDYTVRIARRQSDAIANVVGRSTAFFAAPEMWSEAARVTVERVAVAATATEPSSVRVWDPKATSVEASATPNTDGLRSPR
jgi:hypothetical protein